MVDPLTDIIERRYHRVRSVAKYGRLHEETIRVVYETALQTGQTAIDGGAHIGKHTFPMASRVGASGHVFAFEPSPGPHTKLVQAVHAHPHENITPLQLALSNEIRDVRFLVFADRPGVSGFERRTDAAGDLPAEEITVQTAMIDSLPQVDSLGFIKLDVEGAEMLALWGAQATIEKHLPVIHIEASFISWDAFGYGPEELLAFCQTYGYVVFDAVGTLLDSPSAVAVSFNTPSVWDYFLIPDTERGMRSEAALLKNAATVFGIE